MYETELMVHTDAGEEQVVAAFRRAFLTAPTIGDHFKIGELALDRRTLSWGLTDAPGAAVAAKVEHVSVPEAIHDAPWKSQLGEVVALRFGPADTGRTFTVWLETRTAAGPDPHLGLMVHAYTHEICRLLQSDGFTTEGTTPAAGYKVPPGAPPGWPFGN